MSHLGGGEWVDDSEDRADDRRSDYVTKKLDVAAAVELECAPTYEEVVKAIKGMKKGKSVGMDKISSEMLVNGGNAIG